MAALGNCVCCNNPWSKKAADEFAMMCGECTPTQVQGDAAIDPNNFDKTINPAVNFFRYANGGWQKSNPIPPEYPNWNTFLELHTQNQERLKNMLAELSSGGEETKQNSLTGEALQVATYYKAACDENSIEQHGHKEPLAPVMEMCTQLATAAPAERAYLLGQFHATFGLSFFFGIGASPDNKNADMCIAQLAQSGLGLPDRDYYFDEDKAEKRTLYKAHIANMLKLLDPDIYNDEASATAAADQIYALELDIAASHMTKTERRDPLATYNKMSLSELSTLCGNVFDFGRFFVALGKESVEAVGDVNVRNVEAIKKIANIVASTSAEALTHYLKWHAVSKLASYLPKAFVDEDFHFFQKTLSGTQELKPRWKRAMAFTENALGEALGQMYCAKFFDEKCKARALAIVESVRASLEERLKEVSWMTADTTRENALKKMNNFKIKIGYPDEWIDYSSLTLTANTPFVELVIESKKFHHRREMDEINAPTNRVKWEMTPQTINAYYHPSLNEIVFPAAILQPPFFNKDADDAINYGAMGAIVGHEMTHGFDDQGCKFNADGNMVDWWTDTDKKEYERRVEVMVNQANEFEIEGQKVQGKLTCGENIADLGGLRLAYRALTKTPGFDDTQRIGGFTPTQRFFLAWATGWRQNITKERSLQLLTLDPHGPNEMRTNSPLSNIEEFHLAFGVKENDPMYKAKQERVDIW
jgi:putative endopeptidase